ncbi:MAG TPA: hypothetical protein IAA58_00345 [Candidatus Gallacutalibacter stercoravium]|nr:hypothetical protein [Candidatus Gallacutalibacter stercoravium]
MAQMSDFQQAISSNPYFMSLPPYIQETIQQSGVSIQSEQELRACAENLLKGKK